MKTKLTIVFVLGLIVGAMSCYFLTPAPSQSAPNLDWVVSECEPPARDVASLRHFAFFRKLREENARLSSIEDDEEFLAEANASMHRYLGTRINLLFGGSVLFTAGRVPMDNFLPESFEIWLDDSGRRQIVEAERGIWAWRNGDPYWDLHEISTGWKDSDRLLIKDGVHLFVLWPSEVPYMTHNANARRISQDVESTTAESEE